MIDCYLNVNSSVISNYPNVISNAISLIGCDPNVISYVIGMIGCDPKMMSMNYQEVVS